jgi:phosphoglycerate dehydrogenase-like enzyme
MIPMLALVHLESSVTAFSMSEMQLEKLKAAFPSLQFIYAKNNEEVEQYLPQADVFITWLFKERWNDISSRLKAVFTPAAGLDWIKLHPKRGISVYNGSFHGAIMAESLLAMMLYFTRKVGVLAENKKKSVWNRNVESPTRMLACQKVALVGYGNIGKACAKILKTFGCTITGVRKRPVESRDDLVDRIVSVDFLKEAIADADHVVSILPNIRDTDNLFNKEVFSAMKPGVYFYNIGRGNCCDESALLEALNTNRLAGAGLDVFKEEPLPKDSPLWAHSNIFVMPHASAICTEYFDLYIAELAATFPREFII